MRNLKYKLFPNLYIHQVNQDKVGIFHALTLKITYISSEILPMLEFFKKPKSLNYVRNKFLHPQRINSYLRMLVKRGILVDEKFSYRKKIRSIRDKFIYQKPRLCIAYFIVSEFCNINCQYCFIEECRASYHKRERENMSLKVAFDSAIFFVQNAYRKNGCRPRAVFYGGEPLLNFAAIKLITTIIRNCERKLPQKRQTVIMLNTNGTLVSKEIAQFLANNDIKVGVSLDGPKDIHNQQRVNFDHSGSFDNALKGYRILKGNGVRPTICCTIGEHNVDNLSKIAQYFSRQLGVKSMSFGLTIGPFYKKNSLDKIDMENVSVSLMRAFKVLQQYGVYEDRVGRRLNHKGDLKFRAYDCGGMGDQLVFLPDGGVGPCHAWSPSRRYFFKICDNKKTDIFDHHTLKMWRKHTPFNMKDCFLCPAIAICGGGCAYQAEKKTEVFLRKDERYCVFHRHFLDWYIKERILNNGKVKR